MEQTTVSVSVYLLTSFWSLRLTDSFDFTSFGWGGGGGGGGVVGASADLTAPRDISHRRSVVVWHFHLESMTH